MTDERNIDSLIDALLEAETAEQIIECRNELLTAWMGWQARGAQQEAQVAMLREAINDYMALHDNELDYESSLKRLEEALAATESTEADYRKQIENEALERAAQGFDSLPPEKHLDAGCVARALRELKG
jgi:tRNA U34 5-carboxymethylaminomethyl modifying GTPase MnmE/TrmE